MSIGKDEVQNVVDEGQGGDDQVNGEPSEQNMEQDVAAECPQETWHWQVSPTDKNILHIGIY